MNQLNWTIQVQVQVQIPQLELGTILKLWAFGSLPFPPSFWLCMRFLKSKFYFAAPWYMMLFMFVFFCIVVDLHLYITCIFILPAIIICSLVKRHFTWVESLIYMKRKLIWQKIILGTMSNQQIIVLFSCFYGWQMSCIDKNKGCMWTTSLQSWSDYLCPFLPLI